MSGVRGDDIRLFVYQFGPLRDRDIYKEFHNNRGMPKSTYYSYRKSLIDEGKIERTVDEQLNKIYFVPEQHHAELENLKMSSALLDQFMELTIEDKIRLLEEAKQLKKERVFKNLLDGELFERARGAYLSVGLIKTTYENNEKRVYLDKSMNKTNNYEEANLILKYIPYELYEKYYFFTKWRLFDEDVERFLYGPKEEDISNKIALIGIWKDLIKYIKTEVEDDLLDLRKSFSINDDQWNMIKKNLQKRVFHSDYKLWQTLYLTHYGYWRYFTNEWLKDPK